MENLDLIFNDDCIHPLFGTWYSMILRCYEPKNNKYYDYGSRGIRVSNEWLYSFANFLEDMGNKPSDKHSLDRINNDGPYSKDNCRWSTPTEQSRNRRNTLKVFYEGKEIVLIELCEKLNVDYEIVRGRLKIGKSIEEAISEPKRHSWTRVVVDGNEINIAEYCRENDLNAQNVRERLRAGWSFYGATTAPKGARKRDYE